MNGEFGELEEEGRVRFGVVGGVGDRELGGRVECGELNERNLNERES